MTTTQVGELQDNATPATCQGAQCTKALIQDAVVDVVVRHEFPIQLPTADGPAIHSPLAVEFLKEEQKQRRQEIENILKHVVDDQRYALLITGGFWSWYSTHQSPFHPPILCMVPFIPTLITCFFAWRWWNLSKAIVGVSEYTGRLEAFFLSGLSEELGWENWLTKQRKSPIRNTSLKGVHFTFWFGLTLANMLIGLIFLLFNN